MLVLHEPAKAAVASGSGPREAAVIVYERSARKTFEALVDLTDRRILSWNEVQGVQAPLMIEDMALTEQLVEANPEWQAAIRKRGITDFSQVQVDSWSAGYHGLPEDQQGHRLVRAVSYFRGDATTAYTRPIEGVIASVDLTTKTVTVIDSGVVPLPPPDPRFAPGAKSSQPDSLPPLEITQPKGSGIIRKGQEVDWGNWQFRFAMHPREGLVLYTVGFRDHGRLRSILYRGSLSDMLVPYGDPSPAWYFRNVFDTGEYCFVGRSLVPLNRGVDVPGNAVFYDAVFADEEGRPYQSSRAAALYVRDGGLLWRYSDLMQGRAESRRAQELVLSWVLTAGNYEYGFNWVFHEDGRLEMEVLLTGIMMAKAVTPATTHAGMHGHRVTEHLEAVNHQHFFNFRLDMDIDGAAGNSVVELDTSPAVIGPADPYGKAMVMKETLLRRESDAQRLVDAASSRKWKVIKSGTQECARGACRLLPDPGREHHPVHRADVVDPQARRLRQLAFVGNAVRCGRNECRGPLPQPEPGGRRLAAMDRPQPVDREYRCGALVHHGRDAYSPAGGVARDAGASSSLSVGPGRILREQSHDGVSVFPQANPLLAAA